MATFIKILLVLLLLLVGLFSISSLAYARSTENHLLSSKTTSSANQTESPNLFPQEDINSSVAVHNPRLVDQNFKFPFLPPFNPFIRYLGENAGYYPLPNTGARIFYFFFESLFRSVEDPVVLWLSGGPGASGSIALFYENGPLQLKEDLSLIWNVYGWDKISNIIFVDQPIGTGFSYTTNNIDIRHNLTSVIEDLYNFLQQFFQDRLDFAQNDFYIIGQSYAGHFAPVLASRILQGNKVNKGIHINLKGLAIGNGLTNPRIQYPTIPFFAKMNNLIEETDYLKVDEMIPKCESSIEDCDRGDDDACLTADDNCRRMVQAIRGMTNRNFYDIRTQSAGSLDYDFSNLESFLNKRSTKKSLNVGDRTYMNWNTLVFRALKREHMKNFDVGIPALLEAKIKVLIYAGNKELMCNWIGNMKWVLELEWYGKQEFTKAPFVPFLVDDKEVGKMMSHGLLTFIQVFEAGHMVPMDQPNVALHMIRNWMQEEVK
ncbi:serine carboxypeptidase-like [Tripterygium wilfordii]|uniref:serine carboxypeptidase-like n=1 Tax=Tripterygium wilfordii TaxID=458696 RepID=UPI0018F80317|nr:serine carboxypeptidase-like [Tripterygium wilfordii]